MWSWNWAGNMASFCCNKAKQSKFRQVKASQQVCKTGCWKCEWLFGSLACNKLKKTSTRSSSSWDTVNICQQRQEQSRMSRRYSGPSWRFLRRVLHICCLLTPPSSLPIATAATAHCDPLDECAEPQLPRPTSLEHIEALYWGTYSYIGPRIVVWWCGVVVASDREV